MTTISIRPSKKSKWIVAGLILAGCWMGNISLVQAQTFQRVYKNGVIYYYFSIRKENGDGQPYLMSPEKKITQPAASVKVSPQELDPVVQEASCHYNLPPPLIKAVIRVESNFIPAATSPRGARGLMQLMPSTAAQLQVNNAYDIRENIWAGTRYLFMMLEKFGYSLPLALAAYNAGPQRVEQCRDIPPIEETKKFVRDVCVNFLKYHGEPGPAR
jgi:soluble lytic murein transglycosylase-like protein